MQISPQGGLPLYKQLKAVLLEQIRTGDLPAGARLPSEYELRTEHRLSSTTVRRALLELETEGVIYRHAGIGTFVAERRRRASLLLLISGYDAACWKRNGGAIVGQLIGGISEVAWQHDALVSMIHVPSPQPLSQVLATIISERSVDGIVLRLAGDIDEQSLELLSSHRFPYVVVRRYLPGREISCVISDFEGGACCATRHLLSLGHRRIGAILGPQRMVMFWDRERGYRRALEQDGLSVNPELIHWCRDYSEEDGLKAGRRLLRLKDPPTAIFGANEMLCLGLSRAAHELGVRVPHDLAIVGCDDGGMGEQMVPSLTAVTTSLYDTGSESARLLLDMIERGRFSLQMKMVNSSLIVRESCGAKRLSPARGQRDDWPISGDAADGAE